MSLLPAAANTLPGMLSARLRRTLIIALSLGGFAIGISEIAPMGLLPHIAAEFAVSPQQVGHLISIYALGVVVGAPLIALGAGRFSRRACLVVLMLLYALGNLLSALGTSYNGMLLFRFLAGLPHGAYFGVAIVVAASISPAEQRGRAVGQVILGLTLALLAGVPVATWLGQSISWRWVFAGVALVAVVTAGLIGRYLPAGPDAAVVPVRQELRQFNRAPVWSALLMGAIGFAGMFCVFSYVAPVLTEVARMQAQWIPFGMAAFGVGSFIGAYLGGGLYDRFGYRSIGMVLAWAIVMLLLFPSLAVHPATVMLGLLLVGTLQALAPTLQTQLLDVAGDAQTLASAANQSAFNVANAIGPALGGAVVSLGAGWASVGYTGAAMATLALLLWFGAARWQEGGARRNAAPLPDVG